MTLCDRIDEPINLTVDFAGALLEVSPLGVRFGCETFTLFVMSAHIFGDHARMAHLSLQARKNCAIHGGEIKCLCIATCATCSCGTYDNPWSDDRTEPVVEFAGRRAGMLAQLFPAVVLWILVRNRHDRLLSDRTQRALET